MRKSFFLIAWAVALSATLAACQLLPKNREWTCDDLLATPLQSYIGQAVAADTFAEAVVKVYGIPRHEMEVNAHEDGSWFVGWARNGLGYGVSSENGTSLDRIGIEYYRYRRITAQQLFDCIPSPPEWYWAAFGSNPPLTGISYALELFFPAQGIVVTATGSDLHKEEPPPLSADIPISRVFIGTPGSLSTLYKQRWGHSLEETRPAMRPVPWPGAWEAIHFVEDRGVSW